MCQTLAQGGRRCSFNEHARKLHNVNRKATYTRQLLEDDNLGEDKKIKLMNKLEKILEQKRSLVSVPFSIFTQASSAFPDESSKSASERLMKDFYSDISQHLTLQEAYDGLERNQDVEDDKKIMTEEQMWDSIIDECRFVAVELSDLDGMDFAAEKIKALVTADITDRMEDVSDDDILSLSQQAMLVPYEDNPEHYSHKRKALRRQSVSALIKKWALNYSKSSTGDSTGSLDDFHAVAEELITTGKVSRNGNTPSLRVMQGFIAAQYDSTQEYFAVRGITHVNVHRGFGFSVEDDEGNVLPPPTWAHPVTGELATERDIPLSSLSSFSLSPSVAEAFAYHRDEALFGTVISGSIPVTRILSTPRTGIGCLGEDEIVVLSGEGKWNMKSNYGNWDEYEVYAEEYGWNES